MRLRQLVVLITWLFLAAACTGDDGEAGEANDSSADPELAHAIDAALVDCFDPLHDSDGSGGFFAFCARVDEASAADRLDCVRASGDAIIDDGCSEWNLTRAEVPAQYFTPQPPSAQDESERGDQAPAATVPTPMIDEATGFPSDMKMLEWNEFGGCAWGGDNCRSYTVFGDGRVEASLGDSVRSTGSVDPALVRALIDAADVDTEALVGSLPPGPCEAAVDGISHEVWIGPAELRIDSCDVDISGDQPLIMAARLLGMAAELAAPIEAP